jgi:hypothetical protein
MAITETRPPPLPEILELADLELVLALDDKEAAIREAKLIFSAVRRAFHAKHLALALLYDLEVEIVATEAESWKIVGRARLKLKRTWKAFKKSAPTGFLIVSTTLNGVAGYPNIKVGADVIYQDVQAAYHQVVDRKSRFNPQLVKTHDCRRAPTVGDNPDTDSEQET